MTAFCLTTGVARAGNSYSFVGLDPVDPHNWFVPGNWTGGPTGTVPGADDSATIGHLDPGGLYTFFPVRAKGTVSVKILIISHLSSLSFATLNVSGTLNLGDVPGAKADLICLASPGTLKNTGVVNVSNNGNLSGGCIFENFGTINLGRLAVSSSVVLNNMVTGIINMGDSFLGSVTGAFIFNNFGFLRKPSSSGLATVDEVVFVTSGTVEVGAGTLTIGGTDSVPRSDGGRFNTLAAAATIGFASPWIVNDGTTFTGPGLSLCSSSMELHGNVSIGARDPTTQLVTPGNFRLAGTINGAGNLHVISSASDHSRLSWVAGALYGSGRLDLDAGSAFDVSGTLSKILGERTINNAGTTTWADASDVQGTLAGATFNNLSGGLFEISNDRSFSGGLGAVFNNRPGAVFRKVTATHLTIFNLAFNNDGLEDVQTGIVQFASGGASTGVFNANANAGTAFTGGSIFKMNAGTAFTGDGLAIGGNATVTLTAPVSAVNYSLLLGTLDGSGDLNISHDFDMGLDSGGSTLAGFGALNIGPFATINLTSSQRKTVVQRHINNAGTAVWVGVGDIVMSEGAIFQNQVSARFYANNNASFRSAGGATPQFINNGAFIKSDSTGTTTFDGPVFINNGLIDILSGTLDFHFPTFTQMGGSLNLNGGNLKSSINSLELKGGILQGAGKITGSLNNSGGTVSPGHSPGLINGTGDYVQTGAGALKIQIDGTTAGIDYDQLKLTGAATLGGALGVTIENGFAPNLGAEFQIISAAKRNGTFATLNLPAGLSVDYRGADVFIVVTGEVPTQILPSTISGTGINFGFNSIKSRSYTVQATGALNNPIWTGFTNFIGNGLKVQFDLPAPTATQQYFRVINP